MAMSNTNLQITVEEPGWENALPGFGTVANRVAIAVFDYLEKNDPLDFLCQEYPINIGLNLSNDDNVQILNRDFRGMDKPTNVLSFANIDDPDFADDCETYQEVELGDIVIALQTLQREADIKGIPLADHFCHLLTHGLLHLCGFDHLEDDEAEVMEAAEIKILSSLNINNPYQE